MTPRSLTAIEPDRFRILDHHLENIRILRSLGRRHEAGEKCCGSQGYTWRDEGGLRDRVVLGEVVEFDYVADLGDDVFGVEVQAGAADCDGVGCAGRGDCGSGGGVVGCCWGGEGRGEKGGAHESDGGERDHFG